MTEGSGPKRGEPGVSLGTKVHLSVFFGVSKAKAAHGKGEALWVYNPAHLGFLAESESSKV